MIPYSLLIEQKVTDKSGSKGQGFFKIIHRAPKLFICETIINEKKVKKKVPTENIIAMWKVMSAYAIGRSIKSRTVAANVISELEITRFNRGEEGSFDFAKFFGERKDYYKYFYGPLKILQSEGVIAHNKSGTVSRLMDKWELQTQINN